MGSPAALAIGKVLIGADPDFVGTAFAVSAEHALTAFHCVGHPESGKLRADTLWLRFAGTEPVAATFVAGDPALDYALLRIDNLPPSLRPVPLLTHAFVHEPMRCVGYPVGLKGPSITSIGGRVTAPDSEVFDAPAIQLFADESAAGLRLPGMSGAPVLVRNPEGAIGVVRWNPPRANDPLAGVGGMVFSCPVEHIVARHPELATSVASINYEAKIDELAEAVGGLPEEARDELMGAIGAVRREKLATRPFTPFQPEWTRIPAWHHGNAAAGESEELCREYVKAIIRTIARAMEELTPPNAANAQIMVLLRYRVMEDGLHVSVYCPHESVVAYLVDHIPPRVSAKEWVDDMGRLRSDMVYRTALIEGALTPLAFEFRPALRKMIATNANQLQSPEQFLSPQRCTSTSGFLNFLGTWSLKRAQRADPEGPEVVELANAEQLTGDHLDQWFRWFYGFLDTGEFFDPDKLLVHINDPEQFLYDYTPSAG